MPDDKVNREEEGGAGAKQNVSADSDLAAKQSEAGSGHVEKAYRDYIRMRRQGLPDIVTGPMVAFGLLPPKPELADFEASRQRAITPGVESVTKVDDRAAQAEAAGVTTTANEDGTRTVEYETKTRVTERDGRVTKIEGPPLGEPPKRNTSEFCYDEDGNLNYIKHPTGAEWERTAGSDQWSKKGGTEKWSGKVSIDTTSACMTWQDSTSGERVTQFADGRKVIEPGDRSKIYKSKDDQVTRVEYPDGSFATFAFDGAGRVNEVRLLDGAGYAKRDGDNWENLNTGETKAMLVIVDGNGIYKITDRSTGDVQFVYPTGEGSTVHKDKSVEQTFANGTKSHVNPDGSVSEMTSPNGRRFEMSETGGWSYTTRQGDTIAAVAQDCLLLLHCQERAYAPAPGELEAEVRRLASANYNVKETEAIRPGERLQIPVSDS